MIKDSDILVAVQAKLLNATSVGDRVYNWRTTPVSIHDGAFINLLIQDRPYETSDNQTDRYKEFRDLIVMINVAGSENATQDTGSDGITENLDAIEEEVSAILDRDLIPGILTGIKRVIRKSVRTERENKDLWIGMRYITYEIMTVYVPSLRKNDE